MSVGFYAAISGTLTVDSSDLLWWRLIWDEVLFDLIWLRGKYLYE
ncbi:hypothetical protein RintRC_1432 [Richelia intracellularis]|nr:hypothetical protein RintRC_1432 [Richelia intracellularis]